MFRVGSGALRSSTFVATCTRLGTMDKIPCASFTAAMSLLLAMVFACGAAGIHMISGFRRAGRHMASSELSVAGIASLPHRGARASIQAPRKRSGNKNKGLLHAIVLVLAWAACGAQIVFSKADVLLGTRISKPREDHLRKSIFEDAAPPAWRAA